MKKVLAVLLSCVMLFTALSVSVFAQERPSVTVGTYTVTKAEKTSTNFTIRLSDFGTLSAFDIKVNASQGLRIDSVGEVINVETDAIEGDDYKIIGQNKFGNSLHYVGIVTNVSEDVVININATIAENTTETQTINVVAHKLAKNAAVLYSETNYDVNNGTIVPYIGAVEVEILDSTTVAQPDAPITGEDEYFIPYGAVYTGTEDTADLIVKDANGNFNIAGKDVTVNKFKVPEGGFGTFGVTDTKKGEASAQQFGNFVKEYNSNNEYGSIVIVGDWKNYRDYYLNNRGYCESELIEMLYDRYLDKIETYGNKYVPFGITVGDTKYAIRVYDVKQNNFMWHNGPEADINRATTLEYAVRVSGLSDADGCAAVAYYGTTVDDVTTYTYSKEVKVYEK